MKLCRFGPRGSEMPGIVDGHGRIRDLSGVAEDITPIQYRHRKSCRHLLAAHD